MQIMRLNIPIRYIETPYGNRRSDDVCDFKLLVIVHTRAHSKAHTADLAHIAE